MKKYLMTVTLAAAMACGITAGAQPAAAAHSVQASVGQAVDTAGVEAYSDTTTADSAVVPQQHTYSVMLDSDTLGGTLNGLIGQASGSLGAFVILLLLFVVAPAVPLVLLFYFIYKMRKQKMRLAEMAMEKGLPIPGDVVGSRLEPTEQIWRKGITNVSVGLGLASLFFFMDFDIGVGIGMLVIFFGAGQMVIARTSAAKRQKRDDGDDGNGMQEN